VKEWKEKESEKRGEKRIKRVKREKERRGGVERGSGVQRCQSHSGLSRLIDSNSIKETQEVAIFLVIYYLLF
jgi:hypothetical protein